MIISQNKIMKFKPILEKEKIKDIWNRYNIGLNFEKEWNNFLKICENDNIERIFAVNNFLITEFLIIYCEVRPELLNNLNCFCADKNHGQISIPANILNKYKSVITKFLVNFV